MGLFNKYSTISICSVDDFIKAKFDSVNHFSNSFGIDRNEAKEWIEKKYILIDFGEQISILNPVVSIELNK